MKRLIKLVVKSLLLVNILFWAFSPLFVSKPKMITKADPVRLEGNVSNWNDLKDMADDASNNDTIILSNDINTDEFDDRIVINKVKNLTIELNGYSIIKQENDEYDSDGHIIEISGSSTVTLKDSFGGGSLKNSTAKRGGAINVHDESELTVENVIFENNKASIDGGAIYNLGYLRMTNCIIRNNYAGDTGGGIYNGSDGTLEFNNVEICNNVSETRGGGINMHTNNTSVLRNCNIHDNTVKKDHGGGIYFDEDGESLELYDTIIKNNKTTGSDSKGGGFCLEDGTINIYGGEISGNTSDFGGGFYLDDDVNIKPYERQTIIENNHANKQGGGIYCDDDLKLENCIIRGNTSQYEGGGIYVNTGNCYVENILIQRNQSIGSNGGGIYVDDADLLIRGGEISYNIARIAGAGVYCFPEMDHLKLSKKVIINNNNSPRGNLYLSDKDTIEFEGKLEEGSKISFTYVRGEDNDSIWNLYDGDKWIDDIDVYGKFTSDYDDHHGSDDPNKYFVSDNGYKLSLKNGEVRVEEAKEVTPPTVNPVDKNSFIPWNEQIVTDVSLLNGSNWLSGVSGERRINEINTPVTHDSSMADIAAATDCIGSRLDHFDDAVTHYLYIYEQLEAGVRGLDLRLSNKRVWKDNRGIGDQKDDGKNLYMCHGKNNKGGTYYAKDPYTGYPLNFLQVLEWVENFLTEHPTEYIIMDFAAECQHDYDIPIIMNRLDKLLKERINDINPSTGEPFFYLQDGEYGKEYTDWPLLKDVRGKMVIKTKRPSKYDLDEEYKVQLPEIGGIYSDSFGGKYLSPDMNGSFKDTVSDRIKNVTAFVNDQCYRPIPTDASPIIDAETGKPVYLKFGTNCTGESDSWLGIPADHAYVLGEQVNKAVYGMGKLVCIEKAGTFIGFVSSDSVTAYTCREVYFTNFFDGLQYKTVTIRSNKEGISDQTFYLLKGSKITIPGYIYDYEQNDTNGYFTGWSAGETKYTQGTVLTVDDDILIEANWSNSEKYELTSVKLVWQDANDLDNLRPESLNIKVNDSLDLSVNKADNWRVSVPANITTLVPNWDKCSVDGPGTYKYLLSGNNESGWTITLIHTPSVLTSLAAQVRFIGNSDLPSSLTFAVYESGTDNLLSQKSTLIDDLSIEFDDLPKYKDGKEINFELRYVDEGGLTNYDLIISNFKCIFVLKTLKNVNVEVYYLDVEDHPNTLDIQIKNKLSNVSYVPFTHSSSIEDNKETYEFYLDVIDGQEFKFDNYEVLVNYVGSDLFIKTYQNEYEYYVVVSSTEYNSDVEMVQSLINNIGEVKTNDSIKKVEAASLFYDLLPEASKALVNNYETLTAAEKSVENIRTGNILASITLNAALVNIEYNETSHDLITHARSFYNGLTDEEKMRVVNYKLLIDAEVKYYKLAMNALYSNKLVQTSISSISDIKSSDYNNNNSSKIEYARYVYELLTAEQKSLITNYSTLVLNEAEYFAKYFIAKTQNISSDVNNIWNELSNSWDNLPSDAKEVILTDSNNETIKSFNAQYSSVVNEYNGSIEEFDGGPTVTVNNNPTNPTNKLPAWAIVLIVIGGIVVLGGGALAVVFILRKKKTA